jgi:hypothetical protein
MTTLSAATVTAALSGPVRLVDSFDDVLLEVDAEGEYVISDLASDNPPRMVVSGDSAYIYAPDYLNGGAMAWVETTADDLMKALTASAPGEFTEIYSGMLEEIDDFRQWLSLEGMHFSILTDALWLRTPLEDCLNSGSVEDSATPAGRKFLLTCGDSQVVEFLTKDGLLSSVSANDETVTYDRSDTSFSVLPPAESELAGDSFYFLEMTIANAVASSLETYVQAIRRNASAISASNLSDPDFAGVKSLIDLAMDDMGIYDDISYVYSYGYGYTFETTAGGPISCSVTLHHSKELFDRIKESVDSGEPIALDPGEYDYYDTFLPGVWVGTPTCSR